MKRTIMITLLSLIFMTVSAPQARHSDYRETPVQMQVSFPRQEFNRLVTAISWVESRHNQKAVNKRTHASGHMQILKIMVRDLNEHGYRYRLNDRFDSLKSIEMFRDYQAIYNPEMNKEKAIKLWYAGPTHWKTKADSYYALVLVKLNSK